MIEIAAAFATASSFFRLLGSVTGNQDDKSYADILLSHSTQLYNCSKSIVPIRYHFSVPTLLGFYGSTGKHGIFFFFFFYNISFLNRLFG